jgi:hypothetical protein
VTIACGAIGVAGAVAPEPEPHQLDPVIVNPHYTDPLFESDRKLKNLVDGIPCIGCNARKPQDSVAKQIGKVLLHQITPMQPQPVDRDPPPGPVDLSPEAVSESGKSEERK